MSYLNVEGDDASGYWVNLGPGQVRMSEIYLDCASAEGRLQYYSRTCGMCGTASLPRVTLAETPPPAPPPAKHRFGFLHHRHPGPLGA